MRIEARRDDSLQATVCQRWALFYGEGANPAEDRPAHVRAGSGLSWFQGRLAIMQDDACFIGMLDVENRTVTAVALPRGEGGRRVFSKKDGNKQHKLDLECCVTAKVAGAEVLLGFGSGSTAAREAVVVVQPDVAPRMIPAPELYSLLRQAKDFAGSEMNIEGATLLPDGNLRFYQRGNGTPVGSLVPVDATADLPFDALYAHLQGRGAPPRPENIVQYELGTLDGVRLTFTDAWTAPDGSVRYLAGAEDSPDTYRDGEVKGAAVGSIAGMDARWTTLLGEDGVPIVAKAEGIALHPGDPNLAYVVIDADDPDLPTELFEIRLTGGW